MTGPIFGNMCEFSNVVVPFRGFPTIEKPLHFVGILGSLKLKTRKPKRFWPTVLNSTGRAIDVVPTRSTHTLPHSLTGFRVWGLGFGV